MIGTGAVAAWLGHELALAGIESTFCDRSDLPKKWSWKLAQNGIEHSHTGTVDCTSIKSAKNIFITTRSHDLATVWEQKISLLPALEGRSIYVFSNGLIEGLLVDWQQQRPDMAIHLCVLTAGITRIGQSTFERKDAHGKLLYGPVGIQREINTMDNSLPKCFQQDENIREKARKKWIFNTAANTVAGVYELENNGQILARHHNLLRELFDESFDLACEMWRDWKIESETNPAHREILWLELRQLLIDTRENENSMAAAVRRKNFRATREALFLGGVAFQKQGYPALKYWTRKLLRINALDQGPIKA